MSNVCENCIDCNCMRCPIFARETLKDLGYYETDTNDED